MLRLNRSAGERATTFWKRIAVSSALYNGTKVRSPSKIAAPALNFPGASKSPRNS
jgi:hypothetical protein